MGYFLNVGTGCCQTCRPSPCAACQQSTCCLYPGPVQGQSDPPGSLVRAYPYSDLPAALTMLVAGGSYALTKQPDNSPYITYLYQDAQGSIELTTDAFNRWEPAVNYPPLYSQGIYVTPSPCLVGHYDPQDGSPPVIVTDQFAATYTVNGTDTIRRAAASGGVPSCTWTGTKAGGGVWSLEYGLTSPYRWHLASYGGSGGSTADDNAGPQSSPAGAYGAQTVSA